MAQAFLPHHPGDAVMGYTYQQVVTLYCDAPACSIRGAKHIVSASSVKDAMTVARAGGWKIAVNTCVGSRGMGKALCPRHAKEERLSRPTGRTDGMQGQKIPGGFSVRPSSVGRDAVSSRP